MKRISRGVERLTQSKLTTMERRWSNWRKAEPLGISSVGEVVTARWASNLKWRLILCPIIMPPMGRRRARRIHLQSSILHLQIQAANLLVIIPILIIIFHFHQYQYQHQSMTIVTINIVAQLLDLKELVVFLMVILPSYYLGLPPSGSCRLFMLDASNSFSAAVLSCMSF